MFSFSLDGSWAFADVSGSEPRLLRRVSTTASYGSASYTSLTGEEMVVNGKGFLCGKLHPDGLILATGSVAGSRGMEWWDIRERAPVAKFHDHQHAIYDISFSENGYLLGSAGGDGTVRIWDMRKQKVVSQVQGEEDLLFNHLMIIYQFIII